MLGVLWEEQLCLGSLGVLFAVMAHEILVFLLGPLTCVSILLLQFTYELFFGSFNLEEIIIGHVAPSLFHIAFDFFPLALQYIFVRLRPPYNLERLNISIFF